MLNFKDLKIFEISKLKIMKISKFHLIIVTKTKKNSLSFKIIGISSYLLNLFI